MNSITIKTQDRKYICVECKNENTVPADAKIGDVIECEFCGIEYRIIAAEGGEFTLEMLEEEK